MTISQRSHVRRPGLARPLTLVLFAAALVAPRSSSAQTTVDVLITGGRVVDGTGTAARTTDIGIRGDRIVFVGDSRTQRVTATRTVDARGLVVTPGFIDPHAHVSGELGRAGDSHLNGYLMQGVTTVLTGNDGQGPIDVGAALKKWTTQGIGPNAGLFIGQGTLRGRVVGARDIPATPVQLDSMRALVRQAMRDGAIGMSAGLFYSPGSFAKTDEVIALAKELKPFNGVYDTHQRDESSYDIGLLASTREAMRIGKEAGITLNISHIKALGVDVWGRSDSLIAMIRAARKAGDKVWADQYPYTASGTSVTASLVPRWAEDGGNTALLARFNDDTLMVRMRKEMENNMRRRGGAESLLLTSGRDTSWRGKNLAQIATALKTDPISAAIKVIRKGGASVASFNMKPSDIDALAAEPWVMTGSDGSDGHPRKFGTFPKKLREFVLDRHILTMEAMVHQSAALPAEVFGLTDRGVLQVGAYADVIVFDTATIKDQATYINPEVMATGIRFVFVNGVVAVDGGKPTGVLKGRALRARAK